MTFSPRVLRSCSRGFSLTELLLVIGGVAILLALLAPVAGYIGRSSKTTKCAANLRQLGVVFNIYLVDQKGNFPRAATQLYDSEGKMAGSTIWTDAVAAHAGLRDYSSFRCPGVKEFYPSLARNVAIWAYPSYGINRYGVAPDRTDSGYAPASRWSLVNGAETLLLIDFEVASQPWNGWYSATPVHLDPTLLSKRHGGRVNALFCDGHLESFDVAELKAMNGNEAPWYNFKGLRSPQ